MFRQVLVGYVTEMYKKGCFEKKGHQALDISDVLMSNA